jgi:hypothetical protein
MLEREREEGRGRRKRIRQEDYRGRELAASL